MKAYVGDTVEDKPHKRNSVRLAIRKVSSANPGYGVIFVLIQDPIAYTVIKTG
jgi:hypothetical protein